MDAGKNQRNPARWPITNLGKIATLLSGGTPDRSRPEFWNGGMPWLSAKDLKSFYVCDSIEKVSEEGIADGSRQVPKGSILILVRGMTLLKDVPVALTTGPVAFNQDLKAIIPGDGVNPEYLACWLVASRERLLSCVDQAGHGTGRLPTDLLRALPVYLPSSAIQEILAKSFGAWHRALETTAQLLRVKRQSRKGFTQQLLIGRLRFSAFVKEQLRESRLGEFLSESRTRGSNGATARKLTIKLYGRGILPKSEKLAGSVTTQYFLRKRGQFIYSKLDFLNGAFGVVPDALDGYETTADLPAFDVDGGLNPKWLLAYVCREDFYHRKLGLAAGGRKARRVNPDAFLRIKIPVPSRAEQDKIVEFLDALDREIDLLTRQADALIRQKKALMQKLLTGQIRVKV